MTERLEQRYCIKFCQKLGDSQTAFVHDAMDIIQIKDWYNWFKDGINVKLMLRSFFQSHGVVHHEYAPQGQTITPTKSSVTYIMLYGTRDRSYG